ncbi:hypothetical protein CFRS1_v012464 [Colletotrichum fructicola]|nr:hypothetical protein CFRS1_v012464 [Colletotrichum fructicola]
MPIPIVNSDAVHLFPSSTIAPTLARSQHNLNRDVLTDGSFTNAEIATAARCSARAVRRIRQRLDCFGATRAPPNGAGRPRDITPPMLTSTINSAARTDNHAGSKRLAGCLN